MKRHVLHFILRFLVACFTAVSALIGSWASMAMWNPLIKSGRARDLAAAAMLAIGALLASGFSLYMIISLACSFRSRFFRRFHAYEQVLTALCVLSAFAFIFAVLGDLARTPIR